MGIFSESTESKLNNLLERTYDAELGFRSAADKVQSESLKTFLNNKAKERLKFRTELRKEILDNRCEIKQESGSVAGSAHRSWMNLKSYFSTENDEAVINEVKRGEKTAIEDYNDILEDNNLPPTTENLLIAQRDDISRSYNQVEETEILN